MDDNELVTPYCGGCGHLYFSEPKIPYSLARKQATTRRCNYCIEDEIDLQRESARSRAEDDDNDNW